MSMNRRSFIESSALGLAALAAGGRNILNTLAQLRQRNMRERFAALVAAGYAAAAKHPEPAP